MSLHQSAPTEKHSVSSSTLLASQCVGSVPPFNENTTSRAFFIKNSLTKQRQMSHNQSLVLARSLPWHRNDMVAICALWAPKSNRQQSWTIGCDYISSSLVAERSSPSLGLGRSRQQLSSSPVVLISLLRLAFQHSAMIKILPNFYLSIVRVTKLNEIS